MKEQTEKLREGIARLSMGLEIDDTDVVTLDYTYNSADEILKACKESGLKFVGTTPKTQATYYDQLGDIEEIDIE